MSDPNQYVNYYIENALGMVHEYINVVLQAKTQARISAEQLKEKDLTIAQLNEMIEKSKLDSNQLNQATQNAKSWEDQYNAMKGKVSHMDTLTNQFNEVKKQLTERNEQVNVMQDRIDTLTEQLKEFEEAKLSKLTKTAERKAAKVAKESKIVPPVIQDTLSKEVINNTITEMQLVEEEKKIDDF